MSPPSGVPVSQFLGHDLGITETSDRQGPERRLRSKTRVVIAARTENIRIALGSERGAIRGIVLRDGLVATALAGATLFMRVAGCIAVCILSFPATRFTPRAALP